MTYKELQDFARNLAEGWDSYTAFLTKCNEYVNSELEIACTNEQFLSLFIYAWDQGHASGYHVVTSRLRDIVEIVKKFVGEVIQDDDSITADG